VVGIQEKVEEKVNIIHLLLRCWLLRFECLRSHSVLSFVNFGMKIREIVYHVVVFPKSLILFELKL